MCEVWVDAPWTTEIDGKGVRITYKSGRESFVRRMSRGDYRRGLELALHTLDEYDRAEIGRVVELRRVGH